MKKIVTFIAFMGLLLAPMLIKAQTKRALVIGIGKQEDQAWNKINGDKDVPYVMAILEDADYQQIFTLVNEEATKEGIVAAFQNLAQSCQKGDVVYVHFSGHGQRMRDRDSDEQDALDECWIPYDAYRKPCEQDWGEKHLTDDEVNMLLTKIRNKIGDEGKMLVVIDACHSGDATRSQGETVRGVGEVFEAVKAYLKDTPHTDVAESSNLEQWITLSACRSHEVNIEMKDPVAGKLTYAIFTKLKNKEFESNEELFKKIKAFMYLNAGSRPQKPTMTGEIAKYNIADILQ